MEFWGVEVKAGEPLKVQPEFGKLIHISQAALGEVKDGKAAKHVPLRLKVDNKNFIIGALSAEDRAQLMFDLVFEREFELSHDWKNGSVYFIGYIADDPVSDGEDFSDEFDDESEDEPVPVPADIHENGKIKPKSGDVKATKSAAAAKASNKKEEQSDADDKEDDSDSDSDDELAFDGSLQGDSSDASEDDSDKEEDGSSSEEELPKVQQSKKRAAESAQETPVPAKKAKKAKSATSDKTGNKKGNAATPVPSKAAGNKSTPKSGGQLSCKSCNKSFISESALQSHTKAKHGGK